MLRRAKPPTYNNFQLRLASKEEKTSKMSLENVRHKILEKISRFDFLIDGKEDEEDAGPVQLIFTDNTVLELELCSDGESVVYHWRSKAEIEEEDNKTDWFRIELIDREPFIKLQKAKVKNFDQLLFGTVEESYETMVLAGVGFQFENGMSLVYYNAGDFAKIFVNEMPPPFDEQFKLIWKERAFGDIGK